MRVVVPFDPVNPKTRLSGVMSSGERQSFALAMLRDVLVAIENAGHAPTVLATGSVDVSADVVTDDRPLSDAVNAALADADLPAAVLMADLPLVTPAVVQRLCSRPDEVVLAPGLGGGTNALVVRDPRFTVDYHGGSYSDHVEIALEAGLSLGRVDSYRLAVDVDEPDDLVEVLLHGDGKAEEWLRRAGFSIERGEGRTRVVRSKTPAIEF